MAIFPKIDRPCPYKGDLKAIMDGDVCRLCNRQVFDLTDMTDDARVAFMKGCTGEVCVSYRAALRPALAAAAVAVAVIGTPSAALACDDATSTIVVVTGGIHDPANAEYITTQAKVSDATPELPVIYEPDASGHTDGDGTAKTDGEKRDIVTSRAGS